MSNPPIYLDCHATTPCDPRVVAAMLPYFLNQYGNPASISHVYGLEAREAVDRSRTAIAEFCGVDSRSVVFTSGATEANNLAIKGVIGARLRSGGSKPHLITNAAEHRAVLDPARRLERNGVDTTVLPVDAVGQVDPQRVADAIRPETVLVSIMLANNEIGTINRMAEIAEVCRAGDVLLHCDAAQAAGRIAFNGSGPGIDLMSLSAHKVYGPKGIGVLIVRRDGRRIALEPQLDGGGHEHHLRSGTLPVPLIVGMSTALQMAAERQQEEAVRLAGLRDELWRRLSSELDGIHLNGHPTERLPGNLNVSFEGIDGDVLMNSMTRIAVSSGSACTSADPEPSHVLRAIGRDDRLTRASLRFGLGRFTTPDQIDFAADFVIETVHRLRR